MPDQSDQHEFAFMIFSSTAFEKMSIIHTHLRLKNTTYAMQLIDQLLHQLLLVQEKASTVSEKNRADLTYAKPFEALTYRTFLDLNEIHTYLRLKNIERAIKLVDRTIKNILYVRSMAGSENENGE